jgi:pimeloyl-ACP methyl ester carboxylesterase
MNKSWLDKLYHKWLRVPYILNCNDSGSLKGAQFTVVFIHGIGNSSAAWDSVVERLPKGTRSIAVDLLGFGKSPKPDWALYNARTQARSVAATLKRQGVRGKVILVGHSLGALVAIEIANRYKFAVKGAVLCSPPLYKPSDSDKQSGYSADEVLRRLYRQVGRHPKLFTKVSGLAIKYKLANKSFSVDESNIVMYVATLETAIINQTSLADSKKIAVPTSIIHGRFDPLVITANLKSAVAGNSNIRLFHVNSGHDLNTAYEEKLISIIIELMKGGKRNG